MMDMMMVCFFFLGGVSSMLELYGKYKIPKTLLHLHRLDTQWRREGSSVKECLGIDLFYTAGRTCPLPCDMIPFAACPKGEWLIGFLTDFGLAADLEEAYIIAASQRKDEHGHRNVRIVARNLQEFLGGLIKAQDFEPKRICLRLLQKELSLPDIPDAEKQVADACEARNRQICLPTLDGLGVLALTEAGAAREHARFSLQEPYINLSQRVEQFCAQASDESRLALIRDVQYLQRPLAQDTGLIGLLARELLKMGLVDEAIRFTRCYQ